MSILLGGCWSRPPILERWAGLEIATLTLERDDPKVVESFYFSEQNRLVLVGTTKGISGPAVAWRIRGEWLEIDTNNNGTFQKRMRPIRVMKERIVVESPKRTKRVYKYSRTVWYPTG